MEGIPSAVISASEDAPERQTMIDVAAITSGILSI